MEFFFSLRILFTDHRPYRQTLLCLLTCLPSAGRWEPNSSWRLHMISHWECLLSEGNFQEYECRCQEWASKDERQSLKVSLLILARSRRLLLALNNERQCILPFHIISVHSSSSSSNSRGSRTKNNHGDYASSALIIVIFTRILHQITHPKRGYLPKPVVSTYHSKVRFCLVPHCSH